MSGPPQGYTAKALSVALWSVESFDYPEELIRFLGQKMWDTTLKGIKMNAPELKATPRLNAINDYIDNKIIEKRIMENCYGKQRI